MDEDTIKDFQEEIRVILNEGLGFRVGDGLV